jgi:hypothetical protein
LTTILIDEETICGRGVEQIKAEKCFEKDTFVNFRGGCCLAIMTTAVLEDAARANADSMTRLRLEM